MFNLNGAAGAISSAILWGAAVVHLRIWKRKGAGGGGFPRAWSGHDLSWGRYVKRCRVRCTSGDQENIGRSVNLCGLRRFGSMRRAVVYCGGRRRQQYAAGMGLVWLSAQVFSFTLGFFG